MYHSFTHLLAAEDTNETTLQTSSMPFNYVTPVAPILPTMATSVLPSPPITTDSTDFYRHLHPVKTYAKIFKTSPITFSDIPKYSVEPKTHPKGQNVTVFTLDDIDSPFKTIHPDLSLSNQNLNWEPPRPKIGVTASSDYIQKPSFDFHPKKHSHSFVLSDNRMHDIIANQQPNLNYNNKQQGNAMQINSLHSYDGYNMKQYNESPKKMSMADLENLNYFLPAFSSKIPTTVSRKLETQTEPIISKPSHSFFQPALQMQDPNNRSSIQIRPKVMQNSLSYKNRHPEEQNVHSSYGKQMTVLRNKDLNVIRPANNNNKGIWHDTKAHVLIKAPNPYETVLLRPISHPDPNYQRNSKTPLASGSPLDLEHLVSQMEMESEVNRPLGRSADKMGDSAPAGQ